MRRRPLERSREDIVVPSMSDNQTWNDCPDCGKSWKDKIPVPGLVHRTRRCEDCRIKKQ